MTRFVDPLGDVVNTAYIVRLADIELATRVYAYLAPSIKFERDCAFNFETATSDAYIYLHAQADKWDWEMKLYEYKYSSLIGHATKPEFNMFSEGNMTDAFVAQLPSWLSYWGEVTW